jgi:hypothetical protein
MNLLNPVEVLLVLVLLVVPVVEVLPPKVMVPVLPPDVRLLVRCVDVFLVFFTASALTARLPAVTNAIAMTIAKIANVVAVVICIDEGILSSIIDIA